MGTTWFNDKQLWWTVHLKRRCDPWWHSSKEDNGSTTARSQNLPYQCTTAANAHGQYPRTAQASYFYLHYAREKRRRPPDKRFSVPWRSSTAAANSTVISGGGGSVATALCWAAGVCDRERFPYGTTGNDRDWDEAAALLVRSDRVDIVMDATDVWPHRLCTALFCVRGGVVLPIRWCMRRRRTIKTMERGCTGRDK